MATPVERIDSYPALGTQEAPALRAVEEITLPDGSIQPSWPLALKGLEISLKAGEIDESRVVEHYKTWDPNFNIKRHLNSK